MADSYIEITGQDFAEKVLNAPEMVLVNFSTESISACQIQDAEFEAVSKKYQGGITFAKLSIDKEAELTSFWKIEGVPTIVFFKRGQEIHRITGIMMRDRLRRQIEGALLTE